MRDLITNVGTDYFAFALTGILALIVTLVYLWWNEQNEGKLTCPGLKSSNDELGNLGEITKDGGLHQFLLDNHRKFGAIFSFYWGKELTVSIASPPLFRDIQTLFDRPVNQFELFRPLIGESSIQYTNASLGKKHRQVHDRHFSFTAIKGYFSIFTDISKELMTKWSSLSADEHIPLRQHMLALGVKSLVRASFGPDYFKTNKEIIELTSLYDVCWGEMERRLGGSYPQPNSDREKSFFEARDKLREKVLNIINHRRAMKEKVKHNFLDVLLDDDVSYGNVEQLVDEVLTYLIGGFHTTGNLLTWMMYFIGNNPTVEKKLLDEIKEIVGTEQIVMEHIDKLKYTKQVIDETLRCSVLAPYAARYSEYDMVVGGHVIPKQTPIIIALGAMLQNEKVYTEPKKFDPERFSPERVKSRGPLTFEPFGFAGKRKCPGYRFAYFDSTVFLVDIIRKFRVRLVEGQNVEMEHGLVTQPKEEIWVTVELKN